MNICVIIVTYNGMKWYKRCFDSLRSSSIPLNTIVIDNNSSDDTVSYIKENYPEINLVESNTNLGFGKANNIGFRYAVEQNADYIFLLNQDAWVKTDTIEKLADALSRNPEYGILSPIHLTGSEDKLDHGFVNYINPEYCPNFISDFVLNKEKIEFIYPTGFVNAAMWLISQECLLTVGGFDPLFPHYGEDNNYIHRTYFHEYKTGILTSVFGVHDRGERKKERQSFSQKYSREFVRYLIILLDINYTSLKNIRSGIYTFAINILKNLFWFSFSGLLIEFLSFFKILLFLPKILKHRKIGKRKDVNFIPF